MGFCKLNIKKISSFKRYGVINAIPILLTSIYKGRYLYIGNKNMILVDSQQNSQKI